MITSEEKNGCGVETGEDNAIDKDVLHKIDRLGLITLKQCSQPLHKKNLVSLARTSALLRSKVAAELSRCSSGIGLKSSGIFLS